jgi:hypothetical protein
MEPVVSRIDHIVIESEDEQGFFDLLTKRLGLPVAWPMKHWGLVHEAGVAVGDTNIGCNHRLDPNAPAEPTIAAVAFDPVTDIASSIAELDRRGVPHSELLPSGRLDVGDDPLCSPWNEGWTNALVFAATPVAFICDYHHDCDARRAEQRARSSHPTNALGIKGIKSVVVSTTDLERESERWRSFLAPAKEPFPGRFQFASGPALHLIPGDTDSYAGLELRVSSMKGAIARAAESGIKFAQTSRRLQIHPDEVMGLSIALVP